MIGNIQINDNGTFMRALSRKMNTEAENAKKYETVYCNSCHENSLSLCTDIMYTLYEHVDNVEFERTKHTSSFHNAQYNTRRAQVRRYNHFISTYLLVTTRVIV